MEFVKKYQRINDPEFISDINIKDILDAGEHP